MSPVGAAESSPVTSRRLIWRAGGAMAEGTEAGDPAPVDDGWEPEQPRRGPVDWFRDHPARFFGTLGTILFVGGWGAAIYLFFNSPYDSGDTMALRWQVLVSMGSSVTLASGVLWGIAVYIWMNLLPVRPSDS
jgi:hypothetical protein